jgi:hypothetical protein
LAVAFEVVSLLLPDPGQLPSVEELKRYEAMSW